MSQDTKENFGVKTQISTGGWRGETGKGRGRRREKREKIC